MIFLPANIDHQSFYQSKYRFYRRFTYWVAVVAVLCMPMYFVSDCQLFGRVAWETLPARIAPFFPLVAYVWLAKRNRNYKVMVPVTYVMLHVILICTMWAVYFLPDKTHFSEGACIIQLLFLAVGFSAPWIYSTIAHSLIIVLILATHPLIHYQNLDILLSLNIPCWIGICACHFVMGKLYVKHYLMSERLSYLSLYDELTGAHNRNVTKTLIRKDGSRFVDEFMEPISLAMFDIDHFKQVNDDYGHPSGDKVLKEFAATVLESIQEKDCFVRWGGEEFVLILPQTTIERARTFVEDIRQKFHDKDNGVCPVTVSAGIAGYNGENYKLAIDNADKALYQAKNQGRNRVVVYDPSMN